MSFTDLMTERMINPKFWAEITKRPGLPRE